MADLVMWLVSWEIRGATHLLMLPLLFLNFIITLFKIINSSGSILFSKFFVLNFLKLDKTKIQMLTSQIKSIFNLINILALLFAHLKQIEILQIY